MASTSLCQRDAAALLGLTGAADADALRRAFRLAVKAARPDRPGGEPERFRRVIEAYRLLQRDISSPSHATRLTVAEAVVTIDVGVALRGGRITVAAMGRAMEAIVPPGLRTGDRLRLRGAGAGDVVLAVRILGDAGLRVVGDDLYMRWPVCARRLADGGRIEIQTHAGPQEVWAMTMADTTPRIRLNDLGLPARGSHPQGALFVTLVADAGAPSPAELLLDRFADQWTPGPLAA